MGGEEKEEMNRSSETLTESTSEKKVVIEDEEEDNNVLKFLDSVDSYLLLIDSLSSSLRQGWLELTSARHSMGASRINTALLDHKDHPAATSLEVNHHNADSPIMKPPHFTLCKWKSTSNANSTTGKTELEDDNLFKKKESNGGESIRSPRKIDNPEQTVHAIFDAIFIMGHPETVSLCFSTGVQKERSKILSMYGTLVSPKLRSSQLSFETALETLVEIANIRSSMLAAYDQVSKEMGSSKS